MNYDAVVIGAGSGGLSSAVGLAKVGNSVLLIEREEMGGECTNSGCVPSKALLHHAKSYYLARQIAGQTTASENYRQAAFAYVRTKISEILAEETPEHFEKLGITVLKGEASFTSKTAVTVKGQSYTFKKAIIATGSSPRHLTVDGLPEDKTLSNQNLFQIETIPNHLLIIGGGPIGLEMGQAFAYLGSRVTIIERGEFAKLEDKAIRPILKQKFIDLGVTIFEQAAVESISINLSIINSQENKHTIEFDKVLVAVGRTPNLPQGLSEANVAFTGTGITVNHNWQTTNKNIYAVGDVAAKLKFTHVADDTARQVVAHIVSRGWLKPTATHVPKVTYTDPEIAQVGLSWNEAKEKYREEDVRRIEVPLAMNDRARTDAATAGLLVIIAKRLSGQILGAHLISPRAGELIGTLTLAMDNRLSLYRVRSTIFAYPTYSLILKRAGDFFLAAQIQDIKVDILNKFKSHLPKAIALLLWLAILFFVWDYKTTNQLSINGLSFQLFAWFTNSTWGPLLYILAYTLRPLTFFPGTALTVLSGVFFGLWGILHTIIGANLSATLAYFVGRFFSRERFEPGSGLFGSMKNTLQKNPFVSVLTMRLTFLPFDGVNYGAGLLRVPFWPYLAATFIGTILGIITFVSLGASLSIEEIKQSGFSLDIINGRFLALSAVIFILSLVVTRFIPKRKS